MVSDISNANLDIKHEIFSEKYMNVQIGRNWYLVRSDYNIYIPSIIGWLFQSDKQINDVRFNRAFNLLCYFSYMFVGLNEGKHDTIITDISQI